MHEAYVKALYNEGIGYLRMGKTDRLQQVRAELDRIGAKEEAARLNPSPKVAKTSAQKRSTR